MWYHFWRSYFSTCIWKYGIPMYWWCSVWISYTSWIIVVSLFLSPFCDFLIFFSVVLMWYSHPCCGPLVFWCDLFPESDIMSCHPFPCTQLDHWVRLWGSFMILQRFVVKFWVLLTICACTAVPIVWLHSKDIQGIFNGAFIVTPDLILMYVSLSNSVSPFLSYISQYLRLCYSLVVGVHPQYHNTIRLVWRKSLNLLPYLIRVNKQWGFIVY